jgi:predicted membrane-bound dolichyl-phosphate-mannose-protein mannosyltransferase
LGLGFIVRIVLGWFGTLRLDQGTFTAWSRTLAGNGFKHFYDGWSDYLPGYMYVLWILGKIRGVIPDVLLYKLPAMLADLATGFLIYEIVKKFKSERWGIIASSLYVFNPAILANSTFWGQIDSLTALFSLLAVWLLTLSYPLSAICLAIGTLIKPQAAFILPVLLVLMFKNKWKIKEFFVYGLTSLVVFILGFWPFFNGGNFISFVMGRLALSFSQYPYSSINAFNFWGLFGFWQPDAKPFPLIFLGLAAIIAAFVLVLVKTRNKKGFIYFLTTTVFLASFFFLTRMHERHLLPALAPLLISAALVPSLLIPYFGLSLTYLANLFYAYKWITYDFLSVFPLFLIKIFILFNLILFVFTLWRFFSKRKLNFFKLQLFKPVPEALPAVRLSPQKGRVLLILILAFALVTRVIGLKSPTNEYFDEVYHAFTARIILHGDPKAWEWWNPHPEGFAYEWTHPPLAKLGMVAGMKIFGENAFGWRIPGALLGVGSVFLVFLIAKTLFQDELIALLSAAIFSLDGLALVMSRIGMNDSYLLFFSLLTIFLFLKKKNFWAALAFGLAISSKWSAIWILPILGAAWLSRFKNFKLSYFWFLILPPLVYLASYLPMFLTGHNLSIFWGMQQQMWWYHTGLKATHPYTSPWWNWPLMVRPIYLYTSDEIGNMVSRIYAIGNPAIFWGGLVAIISAAVYSFKERNRKLGLVVFSYLAFFVPWAASPRIMFLYHYLPSIPFLAIASGYVLRRFPKLITYYLLLMIFLFVYFYPHWAGLKIPLWLDTSYYWFSSWR